MDYDLLTREAADLLCRLIETPRLSREETAAANLLEQWLKERNMQPERRGNNLIVRHAGKADAPVLLLNAHIDTVRPTASWTRNPYQATLEGDVLYGLGSNDDGASLVTMIQVTASNRLNLYSVNSMHELWVCCRKMQTVRLTWNV